MLVDIRLLAEVLLLQGGNSTALQFLGDLLRGWRDEIERHAGAQQTLGAGEANELLELSKASNKSKDKLTKGAKLQTEIADR